MTDYLAGRVNPPRYLNRECDGHLKEKVYALRAYMATSC